MFFQSLFSILSLSFFHYYNRHPLIKNEKKRIHDKTQLAIRIKTEYIMNSTILT